MSDAVIQWSLSDVAYTQLGIWPFWHVRSNLMMVFFLIRVILHRLNTLEILPVIHYQCPENPELRRTPAYTRWCVWQSGPSHHITQQNKREKGVRLLYTHAIEPPYRYQKYITWGYILCATAIRYGESISEFHSVTEVRIFTFTKHKLNQILIFSSSKLTVETSNLKKKWFKIIPRRSINLLSYPNKNRWEIIIIKRPLQNTH